MVIDFHTHIFPSKMAATVIEKLSREGHIFPFTSGSDQGLKASMAAAGIDLSIILPVATRPEQISKVNLAALAQNEENASSGLLSFGCVHPNSPDWRADLDQVVRLGLKGIKIHPVFQDVDLDDPRYLRILARAGELDLIVVSHSGNDVNFPGRIRCSPGMIRRAIQQVGPVKFVAAHMGGWKCWEDVEDQLADTSIYLDTSSSVGFYTGMDLNYYPAEYQKLLDEAAFLRMVEAFGSHRILFASDSPWADQTDSLEWIRALPLSPEDLSAILSGNARKLLKL